MSDDMGLPSDDVTRQRAIRLFTYLREFTRLRAKVIRKVSQYEARGGQVLWLHDVPRLPGCWCALHLPSSAPQASPVWLRVQKARLLDPPVPPEVVGPWLPEAERRKSTASQPELSSTIVDPTSAPDSPTYLHLRDHPSVVAHFQKYLPAWQSWAEEDRRQQAVHRIYCQIFDMYQEQERQGETFETVLVFGCLAWRSPSGADILRHLLSMRAVILFDRANGLLTVATEPQGLEVALEQDMIDADEAPPPAAQAAVEATLQEVKEDHLWDGAVLPDLLRQWVHSLRADGVFDSSLLPPDSSTERPLVHLAPALIMRKRGERTLVQTLSGIADQLEGGEPIPLGVARLVEVLDDRSRDWSELAGEDATPGNAGVSGLEGLHFPLPANDEQTEIACQLAQRRGVLVQGPPGTGKSHTIVNLVCHLLATGQRVLVTSHTTRALKVLRNKFPDAIAPLCVTLVGDDADSLQTMEDSVRGITDRQSKWKPDQVSRDIVNRAHLIDALRQQEAACLHKLRELREAEVHSQDLGFGDYAGTASEIARKVSSEAGQFDWFPCRPDDSEAPPLSTQEMLRWLELLAKAPGDRQEVVQRYPSPATLLAPHEFALLLEKQDQVAARRAALLQAEATSAFAPLRGASKADRDRLGGALGDLVGTIRTAASQAGDAWVAQAISEVLEGRGNAWCEVLRVTRECTQEVSKQRERLLHLAVEGLDGRDLRTVQAHTRLWSSHIAKGQSVGWLRLFLPVELRETGYIVDVLRVDGKRCRDGSALRDLGEWLAGRLALADLHASWRGVVCSMDEPVGLQLTAYQRAMGILEGLLVLEGKLEAARRAAAGIPHLPVPDWKSLPSLEACLAAIQAAEVAEEAKGLEDRQHALEAQLRSFEASHGVHPVVTDLLDASSSRDAKAYAESYQALSRLAETQLRLQELDLLTQRLEKTAGDLVVLVSGSPSNPEWGRRLASFEQAWNWARAGSWLRDIADPQVGERLGHELARLRSRILEMQGEQAADLAWQYCFDRMTEEQRQNLQAWALAVKRIGKGTGKHAHRHRRDAQKHLSRCQSAIPAWIMPIYRVAESVGSQREAFDVVIVDEASQSGPEALILMYLARKIVVVGDDKQISPEQVGLNRDAVEALQRRYLHDIEQAPALGADNSLFDLASIHYAGRICLREHFRCMPEIIQFSNQLAYEAQPLVPLRQYGSGRLEPVTASCLVRGGYVREDRAGTINPPEAEALVEQVCQCCRDDRYLGRTMGVISLLGSEQARLIYSLLIQRLTPEEIVSRQLVCGDAYAFQGDERDVVFLSLVAAPREGRHFAAMTGAGAIRRFNVAASRARDQMWLFHSVGLGDLSPECVRHKLLSYFLNPLVTSLAANRGDLERLQTKASMLRRAGAPAPEPFESWFEYDVYCRIAERGYRVVPQYEVAGLHIDLVVEGMRGQLAVECDGDRWHGAEQYEADMRRQRNLERCGWTFWRVRASAFYRDRNACMEGLWGTLEALGIHPGQACVPGRGEEAAPSAPHSPAFQAHASANSAKEETEVSSEVGKASSPPGQDRASSSVSGRQDGLSSSSRLLPPMGSSPSPPRLAQEPSLKEARPGPVRQAVARDTGEPPLVPSPPAGDLGVGDAGPSQPALGRPGAIANATPDKGGTLVGFLASLGRPEVAFELMEKMARVGQEVSIAELKALVSDHPALVNYTYGRGNWLGLREWGARGYEYAAEEQWKVVRAHLNMVRNGSAAHTYSHEELAAVRAVAERRGEADSIAIADLFLRE